MNKTSEYDLTIIVPVFNEEASLPRVEQALADYLIHAALRSCVLYVDDGSRDGSLDLIRAICSRHSGMFYLALGRNQGLSGALKAGIDATESRYVGYIDADLQTAPEDFDLLIPHLKDHQLVTGIRAGRKDRFFKRMQSRIANGFRNRMTHDGARDTGCPLKIMWTEYARRIPFFTGMHRFLPALILLQEGRFAQIPVRHFPRMEGVSKYHLWNRLAGPFKDCFAYRWMRRRWINYTVREQNVALSGGVPPAREGLAATATPGASAAQEPTGAPQPGTGTATVAQESTAAPQPGTGTATVAQESPMEKGGIR